MLITCEQLESFFLISQGKPLPLKSFFPWRTCADVTCAEVSYKTTLSPLTCLRSLICDNRSCEKPRDLGLTPLLSSPSLTLHTTGPKTSLHKVERAGGAEDTHMVRRTLITHQLIRWSLTLPLSFTWQSLWELCLSNINMVAMLLFIF